jgi:hypothetical protein
MQQKTASLMRVTVYGHFFFLKETAITDIVYLNMLQQFLIPQLDKDDQEGRIHFQQDAIPPHYLEKAREYLNTLSQVAGLVDRRR